MACSRGVFSPNSAVGSAPYCISNFTSSSEPISMASLRGLGRREVGEVCVGRRGVWYAWGGGWCAWGGGRGGVVCMGRREVGGVHGEELRHVDKWIMIRPIGRGKRER